MFRLRRISIFCAVLASCPASPGQPPEPASAGGAKPETVRAFNAYIRSTESLIDAVFQNRDGFLWADTPERRALVRARGVICERRNPKGDVSIAGGMIHDWVGSVFIPGANVSRVLELVQNYDNHKNAYKPDVVDSRTLERNGDDFKVSLRLMKRKAITVVLDTEYEVHYAPLAGRDWCSRSYSTRIAEIANAFGPRERPMRPSEEHGFLWRLNSYWLFRERDGGVYVECDAVSLTRSIPSLLEFLIRPVVRSLPKEALTNTLRATRTLALEDAKSRGNAPQPANP